MSDAEMIGAFKKLNINGSVTPYRLKECIDRYEIENAFDNKLLGTITNSGNKFIAFPLAKNANPGFCDDLYEAVRWIIYCYPNPIGIV
jgi:hypothetical protein